ncbi:MAG: YcxB family protein [Bacilli bacterium]
MAVTTIFNNTDQEIKDFFNYHLFTRQKNIYIYLAFVLVFFVSGILFFFVWNIQMFAFFLWVVGLFWGIYWPLSIRRVVRKIIKGKSLQTPPQKLIFSKESIRREVDKYSQTYNWNQIWFVVNKKKYFYFYISKNSALICNKTKMNEKEINEIKEIILKNRIKLSRI